MILQWLGYAVAVSCIATYVWAASGRSLTPNLWANMVGQHNGQCGGMMIPVKRCKRIEGRLWRHFTCNKCGRQADDWKDNEDA